MIVFFRPPACLFAVNQKDRAVNGIKSLRFVAQISLSLAGSVFDEF